jgi:hypothetical protein
MRSEAATAAHLAMIARVGEQNFARCSESRLPQRDEFPNALDI